MCLCTHCTCVRALQPSASQVIEAEKWRGVPAEVAQGSQTGAACTLEKQAFTKSSLQHCGTLQHT